MLKRQYRLFGNCGSPLFIKNRCSIFFKLFNESLGPKEMKLMLFACFKVKRLCQLRNTTKTSLKVPLSTPTVGWKKLASNISLLINFVDAGIGVHTQNIELCWDQINGETSVIEERHDTILRSTWPSSRSQPTWQYPAVYFCVHDTGIIRLMFVV